MRVRQTGCIEKECERGRKGEGERERDREIERNRENERQRDRERERERETCGQPLRSNEEVSPKQRDRSFPKERPRSASLRSHSSESVKSRPLIVCAYLCHIGLWVRHLKL